MPFHHNQEPQRPTTTTRLPTFLSSRQCNKYTPIGNLDKSYQKQVRSAVPLALGVR
jgi:hypothetical protein